MHLIPALANPTRVLQLLSFVAQHDGDDTVKAEVVRSIINILWALRYGRNDPEKAHYAVTAVSHCLEPVFSPTGKDTGLGPDMPIIAIVEPTTTAILDASASHELTMHALPILIFGARSYPWQFIENIAPNLELLAVSIRSNNIGIRCVVLWLFCHLYLDFQNSAVSNDGAGESENAVIEECNHVFFDVVQSFLEDHDLQFLFSDKYLPTRDDYERAGLLFTSWLDYIPAAAKAIREHGDPDHRDKADTLELEHLIRTQQQDLAARHAHEVLQRSGQHIYATSFSPRTPRIMRQHCESRSEASK
ncbi:hypothetical protein C8T65DRAFT_747784 [Cerioporus squamosus]|nr:hypothetical protein C8T65DRAFT_747784 [Cerioporus squamosus]